MKTLLSVTFILIFLMACGTGTTTTNTSKTNIAYLYDSAINGVHYKCGNNISGLTGNANSSAGSFFYQKDCTVKFYIGKITLGEISGSKIEKNSKIYPTNISNTYTKDTNNTKVVNILRFIQTIDEDNNSLNGITISSDTINNLSKNSTNALDLQRTDINDTMLQNVIKSTKLNRTLISKTKAISHFEEVLRKYVDPALDTIEPAKPIILNTISSINNQDVTNYDFNISGEPNTNIYVAFNNDGNDSNLTWKNKNIKLNQDGLATLNLDFNDTNLSYFHYFVKLKDNTGKDSNYTKIEVLKDNIPPSVVNNNIQLEIEEQQNFTQDINASDNATELTYKILKEEEDNRSINNILFQVDINGSVSFKNEPDFDENINAIYKVVVRVQDKAHNSTDVLLTITLKNILDNPPKLVSDIFTTSMYEHNSSFFYDFNNTLESNLSIQIDNDPTLSPIYYKIVSNTYSSLFNIDINTGRITINSNDINSSEFDFETNTSTINDSKYIDLNVSVENNNTKGTDGNITYATLKINILNKIDTIPKLNTPSPISIDEHNNLPSNITTITKNINNSDRNLSMIFTIENGNDGNFTIDPTSGNITKIGDGLDYETTKEYNLTIRATNTWWDGSTHYDEVNLTININNVIDNPPLITYNRLKSSIPEQSTGTFNIANFDTNGTIYDQNQTTSYSIVLVNKNATDLNSYPFSINANTGVLSTNTANLNSFYDENETNESVTTYTIKVRATNTWWNNTIHNSNELNFDINITNVIDNKPVLKAIVPQSFEENTTTPIGTLIASIETNGSIYDENNASKFYIESGNDEDKFEINSTTGQIRLKNLLDWESTKNYSLMLVASNIWWNGQEIKSSQIQLNISVTNKIEKAPKIAVPSILNIHENIDSNTIIAYIETNSSEVDEQNISNITISGGNDGNFSIEYITASNSQNTLPYAKLKIANLKNINYDINNTYLLEINATNEYNSTIKTIPINVIDDVDTNVSLFIVGINFNDKNLTTYNNNTFLDTFENLLTNNDNKQLQDYFLKVSKNKFRFFAATDENDSNPNGLLIVDINRSYSDGIGSNSKVKLTINDALNKIDEYLDFSEYDKISKGGNNDGNISKEELFLIFIVPETGTIIPDKSFLTHNDIDDKNNYTFDNVDINFNNKASYIIIKENDGNTTIGPIAKLIGKSLLNFKEQDTNYIYNYFDLMGDGFKGHENNETLGRTPVHPSIFSKIQQGWVTPRIFRKNLAYTYDIDFYNTHDDNFNAIKIDTNDPNRYYLIENRNYTTHVGTSNYDNGLYVVNESNFSGGLAIWEVNNNTIKLIDINGSFDNIFRPTNAIGDFSNSYFEFESTGTIEDNTKKYSIQIKVK